MGKSSKKKFLLDRLLLHDVSVFQLLIYALGVFIGLFIIIVAFQLYRDIKVGSEDSKDDVFASNDYIVMSRKVGGLSFSNDNTELSRELEELRAKPWVERASGFIPANFNITASLEFAGRGMSTYLFFESVPDDFFDELPQNWDYNPNDPKAILPIILPRDYLALYNFGFAASRGLPKMGEDIFKSIPLTISISGNGKQRYIRAKIAGFSSRLNTIAVPLSFIEWGNENYGNGEPPIESRIIAEISVSPSSPEVKEFIEENDLEIGGDKGLSDSSNRIIFIIASVVIIIGLIIASLSIGLLFISIFLLLHKTRPIIYRLLALGYKPSKISLIYTSLFGWVNLIIMIIVIIGVFVVESKFSALLYEAGFNHTASIWPTICLGIGISIFITLLSYCVFRNAISKR